jgi:hypothetical protein
MMAKNSISVNGSPHRPTVNFGQFQGKILRVCNIAFFAAQFILLGKNAEVGSQKIMSTKSYFCTSNLLPIITIKILFKKSVCFVRTKAI